MSLLLTKILLGVSSNNITHKQVLSSSRRNSSITMDIVKYIKIYVHSRVWWWFCCCCGEKTNVKLVPFLSSSTTSENFPDFLLFIFNSPQTKWLCEPRKGILDFKFSEFRFVVNMLQSRDFEGERNFPFGCLFFFQLLAKQTILIQKIKNH